MQLKNTIKSTFINTFKKVIFFNFSKHIKKLIYLSITTLLLYHENKDIEELLSKTNKIFNLAKNEQAVIFPTYFMKHIVTEDFKTIRITYKGKNRSLGNLTMMNLTSQEIVDVSFTIISIMPKELQYDSEDRIRNDICQLIASLYLDRKVQFPV